jgi:hypothetical protein
MSNELILVDREALLAELRRVFDLPTAEALLAVLDKVAAQVRQAGVTREDFRELKQIVADLAEAQRGTQEWVKELAAAQGRTEKRVEELAAAQGRTEQALERLGRQVGGLSETVGGDIEDIAYIVLHDVLKREFGWEVGVLERSWQNWDGTAEEVNIFGGAIDPARPGQKIWVVGEAKHNLTAKEVEKFSRQLERARQHLVGELFAVCFCYRARPEVQQQVREAGIRLVFSYGKLV